MTRIDAVKKILKLEALPGEEEGNYDTVAGLVMYVLQRVHVAGDYFEEGGFRFEVVDMDGNRADKVIVMGVGWSVEGSSEMEN